MLLSFCYVLLRWLLEFVALYGRTRDFKELEIHASRKPRLNPCPATGCKVCAALPMST